MKLLALILFFFVCSAFAQSVWDTPIDQESNSTDTANFVVNNSPQNTQIRNVPIQDKHGHIIGFLDAESYFAVDSVPIYDNLIEKFEEKHDRFAVIGNTFLILGIGLTVSGISMFVLSDDVDNQVIGVELGILSALPITAGIVFKAIGGKQSRHVNRYKTSRNIYISKKHSYLLSFVPTFNIDTKATGAKVAVDF